MATTAVSTSAQPRAAGAYDRAFYSGMAILMALTVLIGFGPTFYLRSLFGAPVTVAGAVTLTPLAQLHGAIFTVWVVLFIVQTALIASHRVTVHRRLGVAGAILAAVMLVVGTLTAVKAAARGSAPPGVDAMAFLAIPLFDMVMFAIFIAAALWQRRNKEAHKRLMLLAYVSIIVAAVARFPGVLPMGPLVFFGLTYIFVVIAIAYDFISRRRVHPVYIWGGLLLILSQLRLPISGTGAWRAFAEFLVKTLA